MAVRVPGQTAGTPGGSLLGASFAANKGVAAAGARGERQSAVILDELATRIGGPSVLHDLSIPLPGVSANVDHVVVSGRKITIIDTKVWAGNLYWTIAGKTYRGLSRFKVAGKSGDSYPAEKRTLPMARDAYAKYLGIPVTDIRIGLIIWPTGPKALSTFLFRSPGAATAVNGNKLTAARAGRLFGSRPADVNIFVALTRLTK
jgi:hypothetical protein